MDNKSQTKLGRPANCPNCHLPKTVCTCGRPTKFTADVVGKLYEAYAIGANHKEAAFHAGIGLSTLNGWLKQNPHFRARTEQLRERPTLRALNTVFVALATDVKSAQWWLERRHPDFMPVQRHKLGGDDAPDNKPIKIERIIVEAPPGFEQSMAKSND